MTTFFKNIESLDQLKNEYRSQVKRLHPDVGGCEESFKAMQNEFETLLSKFQKGFTNEQKELDEKLIKKINEIAHILCDFEICGSWIWATGDTFSWRVELKELGFKFSRNKKAWYWKDGEFKKRSKKKFDMDSIRKLHGSQKVNNKTKRLK